MDGNSSSSKPAQTVLLIITLALAACRAQPATVVNKSQEQQVNAIFVDSQSPESYTQTTHVNDQITEKNVQTTYVNSQLVKKNIDTMSVNSQLVKKNIDTMSVNNQPKEENSQTLSPNSQSASNGSFETSNVKTVQGDLNGPALDENIRTTDTYYKVTLGDILRSRTTLPTTDTDNHPAGTQNVTSSSQNTEDTTAANRLANARLRAHIRNLLVSKEKVAPERMLELTVWVNIISVLDIDDAKQTMTSIVFIWAVWADPAVRWDPIKHSDVDLVEVPPDSIWKPSMSIVNSIKQNNILSGVDHLGVSHGGLVVLRTTVIAETSCNMDLQEYPYDTQRCPLVFAPTSDGVRLNIQQVPLEFRSYLEEELSFSCDWDFLNTSVAEAGGDFAWVAVWVDVRRKTTFYTVSLVLPLVLTSYMNTLVFLLPLQSGEKVSFLVTLFVSTSFFFAFFNDVMPKGLDSVPVVMELLIGVLVESLLVLMATLFVMRRDMTSRDVTPSISADMQDVEPTKTAHTSPSNYNDVYLVEGSGMNDLNATWKSADSEGKTGDSAVHGRHNTVTLNTRSQHGAAGAHKGRRCDLNTSHLDLAFFAGSVVAVTIFHCVLWLGP